MKIIDFRLRPPFGDYIASYFFSKDGLERFHRQNCMPMAPSALEKSMEMCLREMEECGIAIGMAHANIDLHVSNETIANLVKKWPDRFIGCIDMAIYDLQQSLRDIDEYVINGPCTCVNLEPAWLFNSTPVPFNDRRLYPVFEKCQKHGIIVNYPTGVGSNKLKNISPYILDEVACDFPEMTIVVSHGGWPFVTETCWIAQLRKNVYLSPDHYMFNMPGYHDFVLAANHLLQDKMIYGSCYPLVSLKAAVDYTNQLGLSDAAYAKYMYGNAAQLFGLDR